MSSHVKSTETTTNQASQIQTFTKYWKEAFMMTSGIQTGKIITQFITNKAESPAVKYINERSEHDIKPVSEAKMTNPEKDYSVKLVKMSSYFEDEKNQHNELVRNEKLALIEHGYDPQKDYYLAIPYPFDATADGMVFLFIKASEEEAIEEKTPQLCKKVEEVFSSENL